MDGWTDGLADELTDGGWRDRGGRRREDGGWNEKYKLFNTSILRCDRTWTFKGISFCTTYTLTTYGSTYTMSLYYTAIYINVSDNCFKYRMKNG